MSSNVVNCNIDTIIKNICQYEFIFFFKKPNVNAIGLGYKITKSINTYEKCIKVYVSKKYHCSKLCVESMIPPLYNGIKTDVVEGGGPFYFTSLENRVRPVTGGYGISPQNSRVSGSLGCLVKDSQNTIYLLSCNHVIANRNLLPIGTPITQPAFLNGGLPPLDIIANLSNFITIQYQTPTSIPENRVDCAIAELITPDIASPIITFIGVPTGVNDPVLGQSVKKVGKKSETTEGTVESIHSTVRVLTPQGNIAYFVNQIITTRMAIPGDSGAVLLNGMNEVIGLLMGTDPTQSVHNTIKDVTSALRVEVITSPI